MSTSCLQDYNEVVRALSLEDEYRKIRDLPASVLPKVDEDSSNSGAAATATPTTTVMVTAENGVTELKAGAAQHAESLPRPAPLVLQAQLQFVQVCVEACSHPRRLFSYEAFQAVATSGTADATSFDKSRASPISRVPLSTAQLAVDLEAQLIECGTPRQTAAQQIANRLGFGAGSSVASPAGADQAHLSAVTCQGVRLGRFLQPLLAQHVGLHLPPQQQAVLRLKGSDLLRAIDAASSVHVSVLTDGARSPRAGPVTEQAQRQAAATSNDTGSVSYAVDPEAVFQVEPVD